jgi:hypothetical protein
MLEKLQSDLRDAKITLAKSLISYNKIVSDLETKFVVSNICDPAKEEFLILKNNYVINAPEFIKAQKSCIEEGRILLEASDALESYLFGEGY